MSFSLILNDTSNELHVGSSTISSYLRSLSLDGTVVTSKYLGGYQYPSLDYDLIIVNAEGTLSRPTDRAKELVAAISRARGHRFILLNADVCEECARALSGVHFEFVHYRRCHKKSESLGSGEALFAPDLFYCLIRMQFCQAAEGLTTTGAGVLGDSHNLSDFSELLKLTRNQNLKPQSMVVERIPEFDFALDRSELLKNSLWFFSRNKFARWRRQYSSPSLRVWLNEIQSSAYIVTGRFHHAIAAIAMGRSVNYIESRTSKIERLADFFGPRYLNPYGAKAGGVCNSIFEPNELVDDQLPRQLISILSSIIESN